MLLHLEILLCLPVVTVLGASTPGQGTQQQPQAPGKVDPRNHYLLPAEAQAPSVSGSPLPSKLRFGKADATVAAALEPTSSTGALLCSAASPCIDGSCCGPNNVCGFGPAECGTGCQNGCNATAPCGVDSAGGAVACGMNICCSNAGWCGVTDAYCQTGQDGCQEGFGSCAVASPPQCDASTMSANNRKIGYYQGDNGLAAGSTCGPVTPSMIDTSKYTHLYWAFAELDPATFNVVPSGSGDTSLYKDFTSLQSSGKLETWISIGGFDFTTANPHAFTDMVSTATNRQTFINSLVSFMTQYGFQGVDLDWEYPVDQARGGNPQDMVNLVQLLADLRADSTFGQNFGISVTLAPDLWYLQHYDAKGLLAHANWLGFMSYDLHGTWDANDPIGKVVYGQTDINDIERDLTPLWFDLTPTELSNVNFGIALYGRGYTLVDPSCSRADGTCLWTAGSNPGPCTATAGVLSSVEITQIINEKGLTPVPMSDGISNSMMMQITWDDQWIGYDNEDTIAQKISYASGRCFGGTMYWSVDLAIDPPGLGTDPKKSGETFNYGVIGDSWGSGVAWSNAVLYDDNKDMCLRTFESHGPQLEADTSWLNGYTSGLRDAACSGSGLVDLEFGHYQMGKVGNPDVVIMTSGGNNCDFGVIVEKCIYHADPRHNYGKAYPDEDGECAKALAAAEAYISGSLEKDFTLTISDILNDEHVKNNPNFLLYVTGYAQFFGNNPACTKQSFCVVPLLQVGPLQYLTPTLRNDFNSRVLEINMLYKSVIESKFADKVRFVDIDPGFEGHRFCDSAPNGDPWYGYDTNTYSQEVYFWNLNYHFQLNQTKPEPPGIDTSDTDSGFPATLTEAQVDQLFGPDGNVTAWSGSGDDENKPENGWKFRPFHPRYSGYTTIKNTIIAQMKADGFPKPPAAAGGGGGSPPPTSTVAAAPPKQTACTIDCGSELPNKHPPVCTCHCPGGKTYPIEGPKQDCPPKNT